MEQEIAELKVKLLRAEELIQEIQTTKAACLPAWLHRVASTIKEPLTTTGTLGGTKWRRRPSC